MSKKVAPKASSVSALDVAKYFIWKANLENKPLTNKKLQKLLYYAQAWHLAIKDKKLFDADIEAWIHGPVIPSIYHIYKKHGFSPILEGSHIPKSIDKSTLDFLTEVWTVYGNLDAQTLEALSHAELPWQEARLGLDKKESSSTVIKEDSMKKYYKSILDSEQKK